MKSKGYKCKVDTWEDLLAHILDAAAHIKKHEDQLRRTTCDLHTQVAKCIEVDVGFSNIYCELLQICHFV
jgi:hypothetical protein